MMLRRLFLLLRAFVVGLWRCKNLNNRIRLDICELNFNIHRLVDYDIK